MRGPKPKYDKDAVLLVIAEYFFKNKENHDLLNQSLEQVYSDIIKYASESVIHQKIKFPKYSQMRKILISELSKNGEYSDNERLTTAVAYRITNIYEYYESDTIEDIICYNNYKVTHYDDSVIICTLKLPPTEVLTAFAEIISNKRKKSVSCGRINLMSHLCQKIKQKNPDVILAVIPQYNHMIYLNRNGKISKHIDDINPLCDTLCMFVKNTTEGRKFIEEHKFPIFP